MSAGRVPAVLVVIALAAAGCGDDGDAAADATTTTTSTSTTTTSTTSTAAPTTTTTTAAPTTTEGAPLTLTVALVDHPFWPNDVAVEAPEALDELAAAYAASLPAGAEPEMERFLFGSLAVTVFDEIFEGTTPQRQQELMWMLHLSGYFGGRWLRGEIFAAEQDAAPVLSVDVTPSESGFRDTIARAEARLAAIDGTDDAILAAARAALFDTPPTEEGGEPIRGLTDSFGYNRGYMLQILEAPPEGIEASPQFQINCGGLFDCVYATPKLAVLPSLGDFQTAINSDDPPDPELVAELIPVQEAAIPRGRAVWSGGLSVQGFSQASYDQLLDVSSSFLETVQATALVNTKAVAEGDVAAARTGLIAEAAQIVWLAAYFDGLLHGESQENIELPRFVS
ncbi:MAG: hypothetical protein R8F63_14355 [Acidimicrobiales bacterium]|nr:hypothetical protein [Acidimicrobiales bacterium]